MFSFDQPVRVKGKGFYALLPNARAAFNIDWENEYTRVVIPYYGTRVPKSGNLEVTPLLAQPLVVKWSVIGFDGCAQHISEQNASELTLDVHTTGKPEIVVNDAASLGAPEKVFVSPDGSRHLEVYDGRYRLLDAATGAEISEPVGTTPRFSPTGRFVAAYVDDSSSMEVIDAVDGRPSFKIPAHTWTHLAWSNHDSFYVLVTWQYGMTRPGASMGNGDIGFFERGCNLGCRGIDNHGLMFDLENNVFALNQTTWGSDGESYGALSLTGKPLHRQNEAYGYRADIHDPGQFEKLVRQSYGVTKFVPPKRWPNRRTLLFSHVIEDIEPGDLEWTKGQILQPHPLERRNLAAASSENTRGFATNWRSKARSLTCNSSEGQCRDVQERGLVRRLRDFGLEIHPFTKVEHFPFPGGKATRGYWPNSEGGQRFLTKITKRISRETGFPYSKFSQEDFQCFTENQRSVFDDAWRWEHEGVTYWLTSSECIEGTGRFPYPATSLYSSASPSGILSTTSQINGDVFVSNSLSLDGLDNHGLKIRAFGHLILIHKKDGAGYGIVDARTGKVLKLQGSLPRGDILDDAYLSKDGRHVVTVQTDGSFFLIEIDTGRTKLHGRYADDELVIWTTDILYDATAEGAHFVSFKFPGRIGEYSFQQYEQQLRVKGLLMQVLAGRRVKGQIIVAPPPELTVKLAPNPQTNMIVASARITASVPVSEIRVFQDGLLTDKISIVSGKTSVSWKGSVKRLDGTRWISLVAIDANGVASLPVGWDIGPDTVGQRRVHVLAVGIDKYKAEDIPDLDMAEHDARTFSDAISQFAKTPASNIEVASMTVLSGAEATPDRIYGAMEKLVTQAKPGETVTIFFAGHGARDDLGQYFLATADTRLGDLSGTSVSWSKIAGILARARTRVAIFIDACHSGAAGTKFFAINDGAAASVLDKIPSGVVVFAASKGREFSYENAELGGGIFSLAFADVIANERGAHDLNNNGAIEISELFVGMKRKVVVDGAPVRKAYAEDLELSTVGTQTPWIARNQMVGDFALF